MIKEFLFLPLATPFTSAITSSQQCRQIQFTGKYIRWRKKNVNCISYNNCPPKHLRGYKWSICRVLQIFYENAASLFKRQDIWLSAVILWSAASSKYLKRTLVHNIYNIRSIPACVTAKLHYISTDLNLNIIHSKFNDCQVCIIWFTLWPDRMVWEELSFNISFLFPPDSWP